jgi:hypothetical protein
MLVDLSLTEAPNDDLPYLDHRLLLPRLEARCQPWPHGRHCRRRAHRAFLQWYTKNEARFAVRLELLKRTDTCLHIGFCRISRILTAALTYDGISVAVTWNDTCWDMLGYFETYPKRVQGGYVCDQCPQEDRPVFPSREALWQAEVFGPFLEWVNRDLAQAEAVSVSGTPDGTTWARLVHAPDDG